MSEPLGAAPIGAAVALRALAVEPVVIETLHPAAVAVAAEFAVEMAMPPALAATTEAIHAGQHGETPLLAVIQRLVERVRRIRDLLHRGGRRPHVLGALTQTTDRIVRLLLAG